MARAWRFTTLAFVAFIMSLAHAGGTLVVAITGDVGSLDPAYGLAIEYADVSEHIYNRLVNYDVDGVIAPELAESWDVSEDLLRWTFYLAPGVRFHDGTPFDAEAVKFNFERLMDPETGSFARGTFNAVLSEINVLDELTLELVLNAPHAGFLDMIPLWGASRIASPTAIERYGDQYTNHPSGTGPFRFVSWSPGDRVVLEANPDYFRGPPRLDGIVFRVIPDPSVQAIEVEVGGVHIARSLPPTALDQLERDPNVAVHRTPGLNIRGLAMNLDSPLLTDVRVRQAINHAIDREAIVEALLDEVASLASGPLPRGSWAHNPDIVDHEFDLERANELLDEAGWFLESGQPTRSKDGVRLDLAYMSSNRAYENEIAAAVQAMLREVGIGVNIEVMDAATFSDRMVNQRRFEVAQVGLLQWTQEPTRFVDRMFGTGGVINYYGLSDPELDSLLKAARETLDVEERTRIYHEVQQRVVDHAVGVWIYTEHSIAAVRNEVNDYVHSVTRTDYTQVWID